MHQLSHQPRQDKNESAIRACKNTQPSQTIVHAKLEMTTPGDYDEKEADTMADTVVNGGTIRREISNGSSGGGIAVSAAVESQLAQAKGGGRTMPDGLRNMMESGFGRNFSNVRIHTDSQAEAMNNSLSAKAFTLGNDIYFNKGQFSPNTREGQHLMAHELTHVVQGSGKVGRDVIPMREIAEGNQSYCDNKKCRSEYTACQGNYNSLENMISGGIDCIYENLKEILSEVDKQVTLDVSTGYALASIIAGSLSGVATIASGLPFPRVQTASAAVAGVSALASIIFSEQNVKEVSRSTEFSDSLINIISKNTKDILLEYHKTLRNGYCIDGFITTSTNMYSSDKRYSEINTYENIRISLINLRDYYSAKGERVVEFVSDIKRVKSIATCWEDNGYMLAEVAGKIYVIDSFSGSVDFYYIGNNFFNKHSLPVNSALSEFTLKRYIDPHVKRHLVPVKRGKFNAKSKPEELYNYLTDQTDNFSESEKSKYILVPQKRTLTKDEANMILDSLFHSRFFKWGCVSDELAMWKQYTMGTIVRNYEICEEDDSEDYHFNESYFNKKYYISDGKMSFVKYMLGMTL